jgi:glucokinase
MNAALVGIEIGGTKLQVVLGDSGGRMTRRRRLSVVVGEGAAGIRRQIEGVLGEPEFRGPLAGVGVGFGGPVDWRSGRVCRSHQIAGWSDFDLGGWLGGLTGAPVRLDNDANTAALGEARVGAGVGLDPVFYVTLGSGVGGGLVSGGEIYHGRPPGEAEIGHVRLDRAGTVVESRCSGWAVDRRIREAVSRDAGSVLAGLVRADPGSEARHLLAACALGERAATRILEETADDLAYALSHVVHLMHPAVILLGGGLARVGEPLRAAVARCLEAQLMEAFRPGPAVELARLGEDAVPVGALLLAAGGTWNAE